MIDSKVSQTEALAYVIGVYLGDGSIAEHRYFRMNVKDRDFVETTALCLERLSTSKAMIKEYETKRKAAPDKIYANHFELFLTNWSLCEKLETWTDFKRKIPDYIFSTSRSEKIHFISGVMDSEGFVGQINRRRDPSQKTATNRRYYIGIKTTDPWLPDFRKILEGIGVKVGKIGYEKNDSQPRRKPSMRFHINIASWVTEGCYFNVGRKQCRVEEFMSADAYTQRSRYPRRGPRRLCCVKGCGRPHLARGFCNKHYRRFMSDRPVS